MDRLHPHRQRIEDAVFGKVTEFFSLPLSLVFYDLTSIYLRATASRPWPNTAIPAIIATIVARSWSGWP